MREGDLYWSHDGDAFETHPDAGAARLRARSALSWHAEGAMEDGWDDSVELIGWGAILERAVGGEVDTHEEDCGSEDNEGQCSDDCRVGSLDFETARTYTLERTAVVLGMSMTVGPLQAQLDEIRAQLLRVCSNYTDDPVQMVKDLVRQLELLTELDIDWRAPATPAEVSRG